MARSRPPAELRACQSRSVGNGARCEVRCWLGSAQADLLRVTARGSGEAVRDDAGGAHGIRQALEARLEVFADAEAFEPTGAFGNVCEEAVEHHLSRTRGALEAGGDVHCLAEIVE